ncbi:MAG: Grx4 family monothiol glutaredoxin [Actinobacteria bacterium]|nr:Grx4 family monothiol glutaredoxin [Actinomycetota bacterium]
METELREHLQKLINENEIILFMKGNPDAPACGFSARASSILNALDKPYAAVDILPDPRIREQLTAISEWPTIPQLFVKGELVGGSDIMVEMYDSGELAELIGAEQPRPEDTPPAAHAEPQPPAIQLENRLD